MNLEKKKFLSQSESISPFNSYRAMSSFIVTNREDICYTFKKKGNTREEKN